MAIINRVPKGFLGLLDSKTQGRTPGASQGDLQPVVDLTQFYTADLPLKTTVATGSFGSGSIGTLINTVTVPAGELWIVNGVSAAVVVPAAGGLGYEYELAVDTNTGFGAHWLTSVTQSLSGLAQFEQTVRALVFSPLAFYGAGTSFGIWQTRLWPAASSATTSVLHYSVKV